MNIVYQDENCAVPTTPFSATRPVGKHGDAMATQRRPLGNITNSGFGQGLGPQKAASAAQASKPVFEASKQRVVVLGDRPTTESQTGPVQRLAKRVDGVPSRLDLLASQPPERPAGMCGEELASLMFRREQEALAARLGAYGEALRTAPLVGAVGRVRWACTERGGVQCDVGGGGKARRCVPRRPEVTPPRHLVQHPRPCLAPGRKHEPEPVLPPTPSRPSKSNPEASDFAQGERDRSCAAAARPASGARWCLGSRGARRRPRTAPPAPPTQACASTRTCRRCCRMWRWTRISTPACFVELISFPKRHPLRACHGLLRPTVHATSLHVTGRQLRTFTCSCT